MVPVLCGAGRGKGDCHRRKADTPGPPILELDYVFLRTGLPGDRTAIVLVGMMKGTGFAFAKVVSCKGKSDPLAVAGRLQWCRTEVGLHGELRVRTDGEPAIQALAADFAVRRAPLSTLVETTPAYSPGSVGACDRFAETLAGLLRTMRLYAERKYQVIVTATHPLFEHLVTHAEYVYNRFHVRNAIGVTAFELVYKRAYRSVMYPFGAPVMIRLPTATHQPKLDARWLPGLWVGRQPASDEHLAITKEGLMASRSCKETCLSEIGDMPEFLKALKWNLTREFPEHREAPEVGRPVAAPGASASPDESARVQTVPPRPERGRPNIVELRQFQRERGRTSGCPACEVQAAGHHHTPLCLSRRGAWKAGRDVPMLVPNVGKHGLPLDLPSPKRLEVAASGSQGMSKRPAEETGASRDQAGSCD